MYYSRVSRFESLLNGARSDRFRGLNSQLIENADDELNVALLELKSNTTKINIYSQGIPPDPLTQHRPLSVFFF